MTASEEKNRPLRSQPFEGLASPFLEQEFLTGQVEAEWEEHLGALEAEGAFQTALEQPWAPPGAAESESAETLEDESASSDESAFEEESELEEPGIVRGDDRVRVKHTTGVPWRWICKIAIEDSQGRPAGSGTGLLISNKHVLTAAHVVYDAYKDMQQYTITVIPALDDLDEPFDRYSLASKPKIRNEYNPANDDSLDWDYALLTLSTAVGEKKFKALKDNPLCYWANPQCGASTVFARLDPRTLNGKAAYTAGYPGRKGGKQLWCAAGILHSANEKRRTMGTTADTTRGQSGSPVWIIDNKRHCLVGVAAGAGASSNIVVRVTRELIRQLRAWIKEDGETPAMIEMEEAFEPPVLLAPEPETEGLEQPEAEGQPFFETEEYGSPTIEWSPGPAGEDEEAGWDSTSRQESALQEQESAEWESESIYEPEYEDQKALANQKADAFVLNKDGKDYFTTFPQLGDLTIQKATILAPSNFESLMDHMLASNQKNFIVDAHGNPAGLSMHLASGTKISATKQSLFILRGIERIRTLMRVAQESGTIWERASGAELDRWRRILESMHSKTWQTMVGPTWPTETPQVSDVNAAKRIVQSRLASLADSLFPGPVTNKRKRVDRLIKKMLQLQAQGIREIQFRACNIGKDPVTLNEFREFFGADHLCAPDVRTGMAPVVPSIDRGAVDRLAKRAQTQVDNLPGGRFAILIEISGEAVSTYAAADAPAAAREWVSRHLMANSGYRSGKLPLHFLQAQPIAFALDQEYAAHIQCRSSFWEGAVRANELEEQDAALREQEPETGELAPASVQELDEEWTGEAMDYETDETPPFDSGLRPESAPLEIRRSEQEAPPDLETGLFQLQVSETRAVPPFPRYPYVLGLEMTNTEFSNCAGGVETDPDTALMCGAVADVTDDPELPAFYAHNPIEMLYVGSLAKIYPMYVAFELRRRVQEQAKDMIKLGLSTDMAGWERQVFAALEKAWKPQLKAAFRALPQDFPKLAEIFVLSPTGDVKFAKNDPPLTDVDLDFRPAHPKPGHDPISPEFKTPPGKFFDWMRLMLRWSNNEAASKCIRALGYSYINGVLAAAGFFDKSNHAGLWMSGDYLGHDWLPGNGAGQPLSPRWARLQRRKVTNFAGTAFQVARLMTLLAQGRLVDKDSSREMISIMTGVAGIGSYVRGGLVHATPPRAFTSIASKIGCGDEVPPPACGFTHDCAIVRVDRGGDPARTIRYVAVALGGHPRKARSDLGKMVVGFHDCVVARHP